MSSRTPAATPAAVASLATFGGAMAALHQLGHGILAGPPLGSIAALVGWATDRDPAVVAMVLLRLLSLAVGYHVLVTTLMVVIGRVVHAPRLVTLADAMTLPMFRGTAGRLAGLAISTAAVVGGTLPTGGTAPAAVATPAAPAPGDAVMGPLLIERVALPPGNTPSAGSTTATIRAVTQAAVPTAAPAPSLHRVKPGDHLWGIAEEAVRAALGRTPSDAEVDPFWRQVILANPDLVDPDLIFPGQVVVVPPVPRPPG